MNEGLKELIAANRAMADGISNLSNSMMNAGIKITEAHNFHWWTPAGDLAQEIIHASQQCQASANSLRAVADRLEALDSTRQPSTAVGDSGTPGA